MELKASNDYWIHIRNGRAKKVYQDFKGAIDEYGKAIKIYPNLLSNFSTLLEFIKSVPMP